MNVRFQQLASAWFIFGLALPVFSQDQIEPGLREGSRPQEELVRPLAVPDLSDKALLELQRFRSEIREIQNPRELRERVERERMLQTPPWRIGVLCEPVEPILREYLPIPEESGLVVREVVPDTPADRAGLREGDILASVAGDPPVLLPDLAALREQVGNAGREGRPLRLVRLREGRKDMVALEPEKVPRRRDWGAAGVQDFPDGSAGALRRQMRELAGRFRDETTALRERQERESRELDRRFRELREQQRQQFREFDERIDQHNQAIERLRDELRRRNKKDPDEGS